MPTMGFGGLTDFVELHKSLMISPSPVLFYGDQKIMITDLTLQLALGS
jgi:hypothetical protein